MALMSGAAGVVERLRSWCDWVQTPFAAAQVSVVAAAIAGGKEDDYIAAALIIPLITVVRLVLLYEAETMEGKPQ